MADVVVRGADQVERDLARVADGLPELDLSRVVEELSSDAAAHAPRRTGVGVASFSTGKAGGLDTFTVGALHMAVQEFGSPSKGITGRRFVGAALAVQRGGRAVELAEQAVSELLAETNL